MLDLFRMCLKFINSFCLLAVLNVQKRHEALKDRLSR